MSTIRNAKRAKAAKYVQIVFVAGLAAFALPDMARAGDRYALIVLLLSAEWTLRRRWGLR